MKFLHDSRPRRKEFARSVMRTATVLLGSVLVTGMLSPFSAQEAAPVPPLSLEEAVRIALEKNPQRKVALADTKAAASDVNAARSALLPHVSFSESATRGNDPVYVFGSKLRQERFAASDFALNVLNTPAPFGNFSTRFGGDWNVFDSLASWRSLRRAIRMEEANNHQLKRADQEIEFRTIETYYAALFAQKRVELAEQAVKTAAAILERSKNRFESGIVVQSDYLTAQVRVATRKLELIRAQNNTALTRAQLLTAMGLSTRNDFELADVLAERTLPVMALEQLERQALEARPDLQRIRSEAAAQHEATSIAKSSFGPRVNAYAGWELDNPTLLAGGGGNNWIAGVQVHIDLFQGGAKRAQLAHERATEEKLSALQESAKDAARLEVQRAYYEMDAAQKQIEVARLSITESQESLRVNQDRYAAGISTITDLLASDEIWQKTQTDYWETLCRYYTSYAALEFAAGTLNSQSPVVKP